MINEPEFYFSKGAKHGINNRWSVEKYRKHTIDHEHAKMCLSWRASA